MERRPGEGIIRLKGSVLARPVESSLEGQLSPAAIELMTGVRMLTGNAFSRPSSHAKNVSQPSKSLSSPPRNYLEYDDWGE